MAEFRTSVPGVRTDYDYSWPTPIWERVASIYRNRSTSLANLFQFRGAEGDRAEIVTPFLDPSNKRISVFIELAGDNFVISDGGLAFRIVALSHRADGMTVLQDLVKDYGLILSEESVHVVSSEAELLARQFRLCNALVALRDRLISHATV